MRAFSICSILLRTALRAAAENVGRTIRANADKIREPAPYFKENARHPHGALPFRPARSVFFFPPNESATGEQHPAALARPRPDPGRSAPPAEERRAAEKTPSKGYPQKSPPFLAGRGDAVQDTDRGGAYGPPVSASGFIRNPSCGAPGRPPRRRGRGTGPGGRRKERNPRCSRCCCRRRRCWRRSRRCSAVRRRS